MNDLTTGGNSGTLTVAGTTTSPATNVSVWGTSLSSAQVTPYVDNTWARTNVTLPNGVATYNASAQDSLGRSDTNTINFNLPNSVTYLYDANGNLTNDGLRSFTYDDENQLISVIVTNGVGNSTRSDFVYDGKMRRRIRREYTWSGAWVQTNEVHYVYDANLAIQERDANNLPLVTYTRGRDLAGSLQRAGGIGGLLARTDHRLLTIGNSGSHAYYHADGNGNITALISTNQLLVAGYLYDSFGNLLSQSGPLASGNLYRFSSKEAHLNSGVIYYLYRCYDPNLQRWLNTDPSGEFMDLNLYRVNYNASIKYADPDGLWGIAFGNSSGSRYFNIGWGDPTLYISPQSWDDLGQAAQATLDGIIPFADPFGDNGGYDKSDYTLSLSRDLGEAARDIYLGKCALKGQELSFGRKFRIAPFGNRTKPGQPFNWRRELPHYHWRGAPGPSGQTPPGQGIGWHRPWE